MCRQGRHDWKSGKSLFRFERALKRAWGIKMQNRRIYNKIKSVLLSFICIVILVSCGSMSQESSDISNENLREGMAQSEVYAEVSEEEQAVDTEELGDAEQGDAGSEDIETDGWVRTMEVHFIDVGQGDATLIVCGSESMLIDAGDSDKGTLIQNYLQKNGIEKLDYLILTHPDSDHIGGAPVIITKFEVDQVFVSNFEKDNDTYRKLIQALDYKNLTAQTPEVGDIFMLGSAECTVLAPVRTYDEPNNASIALLIRNGENSFLFTGDAESIAEEDILRAGIDIKADVYKAGHHGSKTSSTQTFLDAVSPDYAVISCEEGNSYGHPHAQTLNALRAMGVLVYRTDEQGSLIVTSDGSSLTWNAAPSETWQAGEAVGSSSQQRNTAKDGLGQTAEDVVPDTNSQAADGAIPDTNTGSAAPEEQQTAAVNEPDAGQQESGGITYVLNTSTKKFHYESCSYLPTTNRKDSSMSRDEVLAAGYVPCKKCNP